MVARSSESADATRSIAIWPYIWLGSCGFLVLVSPLASHFTGWLFCPWKSLTGFACPICGTTRAALALAELRPLEALVGYPLPALMWILFFALGVGCGVLALMGWRFPTWGALWRKSWAPWIVWVLVLAVLVNWAHSIATGV